MSNKTAKHSISQEIVHELLISFKWFFRSLKNGDWVWLMVAIVIASSTVTLVKQLGESVQQSMLLKASESLGADIVIKSSQPIAKQWQARATELGLQNQTSISLTTMALIYANQTSQQPQFQLVQLNGVSASQPLRGNYTLNQLDGQSISNGAINDDKAWVSAKLMALKEIQQDGFITLGTKNFAVAGLIETGSSINPMQSLAPEVYISLDQLLKTELIGPGSRVSYELKVAGTQAALQTFRNEIDAEQKQNSAWQILSARMPSEDLGNSLNNAWLFLDLSALSAVLVAGMSILIASRFYLNRWKQSIALMRAFGAHNAKMNRLFAMQMTWIAATSSLLGVLLGYLMSLALTPFLANYFDPLVIPNPSLAVISGFLSGILVLWAFAWQSFRGAIKTSPMSVLKASSDNSSQINWLISFVLLIALISLMLNVENLQWILLGIVVASAVFYSVALVLIKTIQLVQNHTKGWVKIALSNITREPALVKIQLISVGMVLFVLMLMTFVRQDLLYNWKASLPADTPNAFVINIQPDQKNQVDEILANVNNKTEAPIVRGRLVKVNEQALLAEDLATERGKRLLRREANIAVLANLPEHNEIISQLPNKQINTDTQTLDQAIGQVSVEQSIAEEFGLKLNDILEFNISGQNYRYQLTSIRKVKWQSFQLNFFFIIEQVEGNNLPVSYISNFTINDAEKDIGAELTQSLAQQAPGTLFFDVRNIMQQIQEIMNQATWAVSALYGFTLLASIVVLFTATMANQQSRIQSWLLLRTIGAKNSVIFKVGLTEFFLLGALAGLFAASLAQASSWLISSRLLNIATEFNLTLWLTSILAGGVIFFLIGLITQWNYLQKSPQQLKLYLANS